MLAPGSAGLEFGFRPGVRLRVAGGPLVLRHFRAEYERALSDPPDGDAEVRVQFGGAHHALGVRRGDPEDAGGHKLARWKWSVRCLGEGRLEARASVVGPLALALAQGYLVEPLISLAAAARGCPLVPAAALVRPEGVLLVLGKSRSGKTSVAVRAAAVGSAVLGDDQVFLSESGFCFSFPRRMRLYSDLGRTAPQALRRLSAGPRLGLAARAALRTASRGVLAPPLMLAPHHLRTDSPGDAEGTVARVVLVEQDAGEATVQRGPASLETAVETAIALLRDQRQMLGQRARAVLREQIEAAEAVERGTLSAALTDVRIERIVVPGGWPAERAVPALAHELGIGA